MGHFTQETHRTEADGGGMLTSASCLPERAHVVRYFVFVASYQTCGEVRPTGGVALEAAERVVVAAVGAAVEDSGSTFR